MFIYERDVQYYETDKMGIVHHSNYIKWMEEARMAHLTEMGMPFVEFERRGIVSPVVAVDIKYKSPSAFGDRIRVENKIIFYNGVKLVVGYRMLKESDGKLVAEGSSTHCFMKDNGIVIMDRHFPDFDEKFKSHMN